MYDYNSEKKVSHFKNQCRNQLFKNGLALEKNVHQAQTQFSKSPSDESKLSLLCAIGELSGYLKVRKSLSPQIGQDVAMQKQQAMVNKALNELREVKA